MGQRNTHSMDGLESRQILVFVFLEREIVKKKSSYLNTDFKHTLHVCTEG